LNDIKTLGFDKQLTFHIGTDGSSIKEGKYIIYSTAIVLRYVGHGGRIYFKRTIEPFYGSHRQKLLIETQKSLEVAVWLNPILENFGFTVNEVHADINYQKEAFSNFMLGTVLGVIKAYGFTGKVKPESWAASIVAHKVDKKT
jgi:hypothetical protein